MCIRDSGYTYTYNSPVCVLSNHTSLKYTCQMHSSKLSFHYAFDRYISTKYDLKEQDVYKRQTTNNPSSRNHRLYCIRLDRLPLNIRLAIKRIPMIPLINTLPIKKRIIKSAMLITSFFWPLGKKRAESVYFRFGQSVIFYICRQYGSDVSIVVSF